jgi:hypothetical protein
MSVRLNIDTEEWLQSLGAIRPIDLNLHRILVLGDFKNGIYPIIWRKYKEPEQYSPETGWVEGQWIETWEVYGRLVKGILTKEDCIRILESEK